MREHLERAEAWRQDHTGLGFDRVVALFVGGRRPDDPHCERERRGGKDQSGSVASMVVLGPEPMALGCFAEHWLLLWVSSRLEVVVAKFVKPGGPQGIS